MEHVTEKEWDKFFEIVCKIVNDSSIPYKEAAIVIQAEAEKRGASMEFGELTAWFDE